MLVYWLLFNMVVLFGELEVGDIGEFGVMVWYFILYNKWLIYFEY